MANVKILHKDTCAGMHEITHKLEPVAEGHTGYPPQHLSTLCLNIPLNPQLRKQEAPGPRCSAD